MHTVFGVSSILLVLLGGSALLSLLRLIQDGSQRRVVQLFILTMPCLTLGIGIGGLHNFVGHSCFIDIPFWDSLLGVILPLGMATIAGGAMCWGIGRWLFMAHLIRRRGLSIGSELQSIINQLSCKQKRAAPRVLLCMYNRPLALTCGIFQPTILISTWMVECLDRQELESVLAHELQHVVRRDYLVILLATILRDAFFYLPASRVVHRQLQQGKELQCDDQAVRLTCRPLALASALAKVWLQAVDEPSFARVGGAFIIG